MPQTTISSFSSAPLTAEIETPTVFQRINDFQSDTAATLSQEHPAIVPHNGLDLRRGLDAYIKAPNKRLRSPIWPFGWRLLDKITKQKPYWLCRMCHGSPQKPRSPDNHLFPTATNTTSCINHLRDVHLINLKDDDYENLSERQAQYSNQPSISTAFGQTSDESYTAFDFEVFKGLLVQLFTQHQLPLQLVEQYAFKRLLSYCQPLLSDCIPVRNSLKSYIMRAYDQALGDCANGGSTGNHTDQPLI